MIIEKQVENIEKRTFLLFFDNFLSIYFVGLKNISFFAYRKTINNH